MFDLRYYQIDAREKTREAWDKHGSTAVIMPTGTGKCLAEGTPVLMFNGTIKFAEDIAEGDLLMGPDSKPRKVLSTTTGREMMYRVKPTKGDAYVVNESHILSLKMTPDGRGGPCHNIVNISVRDYLQKSSTFKHRAKGWRTGVDWEEDPVPLDPYFLGLWLGDGHHKRPQITTADGEIIAYLAEVAVKYSLRLHYEGEYGYAISGGKNKENPITKRLKRLRVFGNKHIPHWYLRNSRRIRLAVLAGIIDSDGHLSKNGGYEITLKSSSLADDVAFLARSLGYAAYIKATTKRCQTGASDTYFRIFISGDLEEVPVKIPRKKHPPRRQKKDVLLTGIEVKPIGVGNYYGFTIDGDSLFLLGDFTVTHNTELFLSLAVEEPGRVLVVVHRDYLITSPIERLSKVGFYDVGIEKAMMHSERGRIGGRAQIVFASVQSIGPVKQQHRLEKFDPKQFSLIIWDEAHRAVSSVYRRIKEYFEAKNPKLKSLYLTATPKRKDGIALGNVCASVAYEMTPAEAVAQGWIVPPRFFVRDIPTMDFSKVAMKGQDFDPDQLNELITEEQTLHEVCGSLAKDQGRTIVFCPGVTAAKVYSHVLDRYKDSQSIVLHQGSSDDERDMAKKGLADGTIQYLLNCDIVSEGYDVPAVEVVAWTTPTASLVKWTQGCGRGFRPDPAAVKLLQQNAGRDQSEIRRQIIAQSAKPYCSIITYHPSNCQHQICTAVDILGGKDLGDVSMFAAQVQERTSRQVNGSNTEEDIETAKAFMDVRAALELARRQIVAEVKVQDTEYDGLGGLQKKHKDKPKASPEEALLAAQISWHCSTEKGNAPASEPQKKWFMWKGISPAIAETLTKWRAMVVRDLYENGIGLETALKWHRRQCLKVRDELKAKRECSISRATPREEPIPE